MKAKRDYDVQLRVYMSDTLQTEEKKGKKYIGVPDGMGNEFLIPLRASSPCVILTASSMKW